MGNGTQERSHGEAGDTGRDERASRGRHDKSMGGRGGRRVACCWGPPYELTRQQRRRYGTPENSRHRAVTGHETPVGVRGRGNGSALQPWEPGAAAGQHRLE